DHECSDIPFEDIVLNLTYYDNPGTVFDWTRDNPTGISSGIPMGGTYFNIGDVISGSFTDTIDSPVKVTFIVTPRGPTGCISKQPVTSTVTVNPTPRATPLNNLPAICFNTSTDVVMRTPTTMTRGAIDYDYFVTITDVSITGNTASESNRSENYHINRSYQNSSDTIKSVYYHITPKNTVSGCLTGDTVIAQVKVHPYPLKTIAITKPLSCDGGSDASIRVTPNEGADSLYNYIKWIGPYTFPFEGYGLTYLTGLRGGRYDIDVTDSLGCTTFNVDYITVSGASLDPRITPIHKPLPSPGYDVSCWYNSDGSAWLQERTSSSGVAPFNYRVIHNSVTLFTGTLSAKGVNDTITGLESGNYKLIMEDQNNCSDSTETDLMPPDTIKITFIPKVYDGGYNVRCKGYNDGLIKTYITGGNGKFSGIYTYKWTTSTGSFTGPNNLDSLTNVSAGRYYLTITDQVLCTVTGSVDINEPDGMTLASSQVSFSNDSTYNISCNGGNDGFIKLNITGGSGNYIYTWTDSVSYSSNERDISGLTAGNYYCEVKDINGCILMPIPSFALIEPAPLNINYVPSFSISGGHNINCNGGTGTIDITVTGGSVGTYKYTWNTSDGSGIVQGNEDQFALTAGTYNLVVSDSNGCSISKDITLTEPAALATTVIQTPITCAAPLFDNGSIDLTVTGGVTNYSYLWSNGEITEDISNLTQNTYTVMVTDANGCTIGDTVAINNPPPVIYSKALSDFNGYQIRCYGNSNGSIDITPTSGTSPYSYSWTGPAPFNSSTDQNISDLAAGQYTLVITDSMSCTATEIINLTQPGKLDMIIDLTDILCAGKKTGSIEIEPVNEVVSASYLWSDGSFQQNRRKLPAGDYGVILTDLNNCSIDSTVTLTEPDSIKLILDDTNTRPWCAGTNEGKITLTPTGGVDGYTYKWSDNSTDKDISDISSGWYSVVVTDLNGCSVKDSLFVEPLHETCLIIPNAISPNGDLINDVWNIGNKELYPDLEIKIYNRWSELIWKSDKGYPDPWDGTSNGRKLPIDSYHYIIDLHNGSKPIIGNVTIVR
ncbi:MAG: gliding motility-associated C-terminal domain-containing protein, partial [Bacteroidia bacterium]|nr:gliding motility-associated C-terminal domain-containing protein [Bacteroidia bacterium]